MAEDRQCAGLVSYTYKKRHGYQSARCVRNGLDKLGERWYCWQHVKQGQALERIRTRADELLRAQGLKDTRDILVQVTFAEDGTPIAAERVELPRKE